MMITRIIMIEKVHIGDNFVPISEYKWNIPARSSLMTGRYPINTGMQHGVVMATQPWGLPLSEKLLSEYFQDIGYTTYILSYYILLYDIN